MKEELARQKARAARYRKAICRNLNYQSISDTLDEITDAAYDIQWNSDIDTILENVTGDEEEAYEFKMAFSDLQAECEKMQEDLQDWKYDSIEERFDNFFAAAHPDGEELLGWDSYEGDYMGLYSIESNRAVQEAAKRLERMTKKEIIENAHWAMSVAINYLSLKARYEGLKDTLDIIRGEGREQLKMLKKIDRLWRESQGKREWEPEAKAFDRFLSNIDPYDRMWIE